MPFTRFQLLKRPPHDKCYARIRVGEVETYCETPTSGSRCPAHDASGLVRKRWEKARQDKATLEQLAAQVQERVANGDSLPDLPARIRALSAVIAALEAKQPLSLDETKLLGHLTKTFNDLLTTQLRLEQHRADLIDARLVHQHAVSLFDRLIPEVPVHAAVVEGFGRLLDELVKQPNVRSERHEQLL